MFLGGIERNQWHKMGQIFLLSEEMSPKDFSDHFAMSLGLHYCRNYHEKVM